MIGGRYMHTLWCDDIRQEIGNKPSFMGVYDDGLVLPSLPFVLPRIAVYSWIVTPVNNPFKSLAIKASRDDGFSLLEMNIDDLNEIIPSKQADSIFQTAAVGFTLGGIEIPKECKYIQITARTESEILEGQKLKINIDSQFFKKYNKN